MTLSESLSNLITLQEAQQRVQQAVTQLAPAKVTLTSAIGCVLAEDITAPMNVPPFPRSQMDGIALRTADLEGSGPWHLPIQAVIAAGDTKPHALLEGHVVKIMTGAPLADGADAIIPIEDITVESNTAIVKEKPASGAFVRPLGNDIVSGQLLYGNGERLRPGDIGILASIGLQKVTVVPKPRIALVSTGTEVVEPGEKLQYGQIYDSNIPTLYSLLTYDRYPVSTQTRARTNDLQSLQNTLGECVAQHDLVITTGAVSMGDYDLIPDVIKSLGGSTLFHKVAIKPGKPTLIAAFDKCWMVCLPGNPVSTLVGYFLYVKRIVSLLTGVPYQPHCSEAILADDLNVSGKRLNIVGARLETTADGLIAYPAIRQESGRLSSTRGIDGLMMIEPGSKTVKKGTRVFVELTNHERLP